MGGKSNSNETDRSACRGLRQRIAEAGQNASRLLACRAGVHVDLHANRHFNDLWSLPSHLGLPSDGANSRTGAERKTDTRLVQEPARTVPVSTSAAAPAFAVLSHPASRIVGWLRGSASRRRQVLIQRQRAVRIGIGASQLTRAETASQFTPVERPKQVCGSFFTSPRSACDWNRGRTS